MKNKNDVLSALASQYSGNYMEITGLELSYASNFNLIVFFTTTENSSFIMFFSDNPHNMIAANILINHFNNHPDKSVLLFYRGEKTGFMVKDITLYYDYM